MIHQKDQLHSSSSSSLPQTYASIGNVGYILLLTFTILVTTCMLFQYPNKAFYDDNWLQNGFCISNQDMPLWNSHALSFYANILLFFIVSYLYSIQPMNVPPIQKALLSGGMMGLIGHGLGHAQLGMYPSGMDLRFHTDNLTESFHMMFISLIAFASIFKGTMPLASMKKIVITAIIATFGFTLLNIEPKLNLMYGQAVMFATNAIHMLSLAKEHKQTVSYVIYPIFYLPILALGMFEGIGCENFLELIGGHAAYDSAVGIAIIMVEVVSNYLQHHQTGTQQIKTEKKVL